jgi:hypothetical protein
MKYYHFAEEAQIKSPAKPAKADFCGKTAAKPLPG